jgi:putative peptidoglycan lipid II flippase
MMLMLNRAFFSLQSNWVPTLVALGDLALNAALDGAFYRFGTWGIPLATSVVNIAGTVALLSLLQRRLEHVELGRTMRATGLIVLASAALAGVSYGVWRGLDDAVGRSLGGQIASLVLALAAGAAAYIVSCRLLGVREIQALLSLRSRARRG